MQRLQRERRAAEAEARLGGLTQRQRALLQSGAASTSAPLEIEEEEEAQEEEEAEEEEEAAVLHKGGDEGLRDEGLRDEELYDDDIYDCPPPPASSAEAAEGAAGGAVVAEAEVEAALAVTLSYKGRSEAASVPRAAPLVEMPLRWLGGRTGAQGSGGSGRAYAPRSAA